jgi:hypothetical protein
MPVAQQPKAEVRLSDLSKAVELKRADDAFQRAEKESERIWRRPADTWANGSTLVTYAAPVSAVSYNANTLR